MSETQTTAALPPELLARIFTLALAPPPPSPDSLRTASPPAPDALLLSLARLSRTWQDFALAHLYSGISLTTHDQAALLLRTLWARPDLAALVRRLSLSGRPAPAPRRSSDPGALADATPPARSLGALATHQLVGSCPNLSYLSLSYVADFRTARLGPLPLPASLRELVLCRTHCAWAAAPPHPGLERLTLYGMSPELSDEDQALLLPSTLPNLRALALMGYDGGVLGPCPGPPSIVSRVSSHYNDFGPDNGYPLNASSTILWQYGEFEATCQWDETPERWAWSGLAIEHVRFERWTGGERYSEPGGNTVLYGRILQEARAEGPLFADLRSIYLSDAPAESGEEQAALDAVAAECGRRGVEVVFEEEPREGGSWLSEHFLARCEERVRNEHMRS